MSALRREWFEAARPTTPLPPTTDSSILCYVTDRRPLEGASPVDALLRRVRSVAAAGVDWVQIREKDMPTRALLEFTRQAVAATRETVAKILVNDRLDVALAAGAAGVHLGGESMPVAEVKRWCAQRFPAGREFLIGASCHSRSDVQAAARDGADYVFFGPVFATPAKLQFGSPQGIERLAEACRAVKIPVLAIGGVTAENAAECLRAGAAGVAAIRLFQEAPALRDLVRELRRASSV